MNTEVKESDIEPAERLRDFRQRHGDISQAVAAGWCNTPVRTWEGWEALHRRPPACLWVLIEAIDVHGPPPWNRGDGSADQEG